MTFGTFYLHAFGLAVVRHLIAAVALGLGHEVDVFDVGTLLEGDSPVGVVVTYGSVDIEAIEEALNDYEEEHEDEDVFYSFHEFEITDP